MNLAAHFFADRKATDSYFIIGAATPDLLSIFHPSQRFKPTHLKKASPAVSDEEDSFRRGLERHFEVDKIFHSSALFHTETRYLSEALKQHFPGSGIPRKFFIAHILLELLLDKVLVTLHPDFLDRYYDHFDKLSPFSQVLKFTENVFPAPLDRYEVFLRKFSHNRSLYSYAHRSHIIFVLSRILHRVGLPQNPYIYTNIFKKLMADYEVRLSKIHQGFFEEINFSVLS